MALNYIRRFNGLHILLKKGECKKVHSEKGKDKTRPRGRGVQCPRPVGRALDARGTRMRASASGHVKITGKKKKSDEQGVRERKLEGSPETHRELNNR